MLAKNLGVTKGGFYRRFRDRAALLEAMLQNWSAGRIAAIEKHLMRAGFVLRHDPREISGERQPIEGVFLACSLWLADAYVLAGEIGKAQALFDRVVAVANDVGLLAEEFDTDERRQTGNFPQALTHIALINTAHNLSLAKKPADKPAVQRST